MESDGPFAYWINGIAGVGKSILARHLAEFLENGDRLGCLVHLGVNSHHSPSSLIQAMARQLAERHPPPCHDAIADEAKRKPSDVERLDSIFKRYLYKPIELLKASAPLVFILDALDEWPRWHAEAFIKVLNNAHGGCIRFIFTSRSYDEIGNTLRHLSHREFRLLTVPDIVMKSYFQAFFRDTSPQLHLGDIRPDEIDSLVHQANGLFIWAATVCRLIEYPYGEAPRDVLKRLISLPSTAVHDSESLMRNLYDEGLQRLCGGQEYQCDTLRRVLHVMATMQHNLSLQSFSTFVGIRKDQVRQFHSHMRAFYNFTQQQWNADVIQPLHVTTHASFRDFLFNNDATAHKFVIRLQDGHSIILGVCHSHVKRFLENPDIMLFETFKDLPSHFEEYVFTYWMLHGVAAERSGFLLDDALHKHLQILHCLICPSDPKLSMPPSLPSFKVPGKIVSTIRGIMIPLLDNIDDHLLPTVSIHLVHVKPHQYLN